MPQHTVSSTLVKSRPAWRNTAPTRTGSVYPHGTEIYSLKTCHSLLAPGYFTRYAHTLDAKRTIEG